MSNIEEINLNLDEKSYKIYIGTDAASKLKGFLEANSYSKIFVVTDYNVASSHLERFKKIIPKAEYLIANAGEQSKAFPPLQDLCERILAKGADRNSLIIAFGGGVVGDLAGFAASILLRGIDFVQMPTTLLSMVDSSVGGKTGINCKHGKNLIGAFYQPKMVICDTSFLATLPLRQIRSGYAEIIKYGLIADRNFYDFLSENFSKIMLLEEKFVVAAIKRSCEIKAQIVSKDETEQGIRAILNFGHTFAHILEAETEYGNILNHGEAVAIGMLMAAQMSNDIGLLASEELENIRSHLQECGFRLNLRDLKNNWSIARLTKFLTKDKKVKNGKARFILLKDIGNVTIKRFESHNEFNEVLIKFGAH